MGSQAVFAIVLLLAAVKAQEVTDPGKVGFWKTEFTMTCPKGQDDEVKWYKNDKENKGEKNFEFTQEYNSDTKGLYHCSYTSEPDSDKKSNYYFYVRGKVCEHCYELDSYVIGLAIAVDVVATLCVMMLIYTCAQSKNPEASVPAPRVPARPGGQGPTTSQTYESLNPNTRANDTYSKVKRTG